ncbi:transglycosylase SLT domain-containing protein [Pseudomonas sp. NPDC089422]|uniref:transglycosylase SLT domain-containing protein n=1 Tax=Pseudomonas sp. NPDC089422 TaxID=3364466 RepID=UPI00382DAB79
MAASVNVGHGLSVLLALVPMALWAQIPEAYQRVARHSGVPANVLFAVALQESGISLRKRRLPWPWTLNIAGRGRYYASSGEACRALLKAQLHTRTERIDVGLMQLNLGYQQRHYQQPCELLDPARNLTVAATILRQHRRIGESWIPAIGRYHRPAGGAAAVRYRRSVAKHLDQLAVERLSP